MDRPPLVRENIIEHFSSDALALYLFLLTVGDEDGVSWYSDASIRKRLKGLNLTAVSLKNLRDELISGELIAYRKPYYQVLELPRPQLANNFRRVLKSAMVAETDDRTADALPISAIISNLAGGAQ